jgi:phosphoribosyl-ATP pyrophosphohydrolase
MADKNMTAPSPVDVDVLDQHTLDALYAVVASRKGGDPEASYTAKLFAKGRKKIAQKVGEEGVETAIAAVAEDNRHVISESADLLYHLTVLWADCGITPDEVWEELRQRFGTSGVAEKKARKK